MVKFDSTSRQWESSKVPFHHLSNFFLGDVFLKKMKETPDRVLQISHKDNFQVTCSVMMTQSIRIAQNMIKLGLRSDDVVGVICKHSNEMTYFINACIMIGCPINPLDLSLSMEELRNLFNQTKPKLVVCDNEVLTKVRQAMTLLKLPLRIFVPHNTSVNGAFDFEELLKPSGNVNSFEPPKFVMRPAEKLLALLCSSGTTEVPKVVKISHSIALGWLAFLKISLDTRSLTFSPLHWIFGFLPHLVKFFGNDDTTILTNQNFSIKVLSEIVENHKVTNLTLTTLDLKEILKSDFAHSCDHDTLKNFICVGSIVPEALRQKFASTFPDKNLTIFYGLTEVPVSMTLAGEYKKGLSVGSLVFPNTIIKIVGDEGQKLKENETGEICVKSYQKFQVRTF